MAKTAPVDIWVTNTGITYNWHESSKDSNGKASVKGHAVSVEFVGATGAGTAEGIGQQPGLANFYQGKIRHAGVRSFSAATIKDLYPGVDLVSYFDKDEHKPRYDLIVHKGADPKQIRMRYKGVKDLKVTPEGEVKYAVAFDNKQDVSVGEERQMAYQSSDKGVPYRFMPRQVMNTDGTVGFDVAGYHKDRDLVIDPLVWSTLFGGDNSSYLQSVRVDTNGNVYVSGQTNATSFPFSPGTANTGTAGDVQDALIAKFDSSGNRLYTTFFGGTTGDTLGAMVAFDSGGFTYVCGDGSSTTLPTTTGPAATAGVENGFIAKLDGNGAVVYAANLTGTEFGQTGVALASNCLVVDSTDTPIVGLNAGNSGIFAKFNSSGVLSADGFACTGPVQSVTGIDVDASNNIYACGVYAAGTLNLSGGYMTVDPNASMDLGFPSAYISRIASGGSSPTNETLLGGVGESAPTRVKVDGSGNIFVMGDVFGEVGQTKGGVPQAITFPTTAGAFNTSAIPAGPVGYLSKFTNDLTTLSASTLIMSNNRDSTEYLNALDLCMDSSGQPMIAAVSQLNAGGVPLTWDYFSGRLAGGELMRFSADLTTETYGTYFGIGGTVVALGLTEDTNGLVYIVGETDNPGFPITAGAYQTLFSGTLDGFISVLNTAVTQGLTGIHSDRGATPALAGGVGKTTTITVDCVLPTGTEVDFSSNRPDIVAFGGAATGAAFVSGYLHAVSIAAGTISDVTTDTPVIITATSGAFTQQITLTVKPFLKNLVLRGATVTGGSSLTAYVYPYEVPQTDQVVNLSSSVANLIPSGSTVTIKGLSSGGTSGPSTVVLTAGTVAADTVGTITATATTTNPSSVSTALDVLAPKVTSISFNPATVASGGSSVVTVTIGAVLASDLTVNLTSSNPTVSPNVSVLVTAGTLSGANTVTTNQVVGSTPVKVKYTNIVTPTNAGFLTVTPLTATAGMSQNPVVEGDTPSLIVNLSAATSVDLPITVLSSNPTLVPSTGGTVSATTSQVSIPVPTNFTSLANPTTIKLTLTSNGLTVGTTSFTLRGIVTSENVDGTVTGGNAANGSVGFFETYNGAGTVTVTSNNSAAFFGTPGTLSTTISATGLSSVPFVISTSTVTKTVTATIKVSALGYPTQTFHLVISP